MRFPKAGFRVFARISLAALLAVFAGRISFADPIGVNVVIKTPALLTRCSGHPVDVVRLQTAIAGKFNEYWKYLEFRSSDSTQYPKLEIVLEDRLDTHLWIGLWPKSNVSRSNIRELGWVFAGPEQPLPACGTEFERTFLSRIDDFLKSPNREALAIELRNVPLGTKVYPTISDQGSKRTSLLAVLPIDWASSGELASSKFRIDYEDAGGFQIHVFSLGVGQCAPYVLRPRRLGLLIRHSEWDGPAWPRTSIDPLAPPRQLGEMKAQRFFLSSPEDVGLAPFGCDDKLVFRAARDPRS